MKAFIFSILILVASLVLMSFSSNPKSSTSLSCKNHVKNGDAATQGDHWSIEGHWARVVESDNNNNYAYSLWNTSGELSGFTQDIKIKRHHWGKEATLSGWVKRDNEGDENFGRPIIRANFFNADGVTILSEVLKGTSDEWELLRRRITMPEGAVRVQIRLKAGNEERGTLQGGFKAYFDNIAFTKCDETLPRPGTI